ncbi:sulfatase-like hydrolase/transferase [Streptomyces sp. L06]|nr:sulfatase-like hydrolase/transferase [Streptomyces sp. L06]
MPSSPARPLPTSPTSPLPPPSPPNGRSAPPPADRRPNIPFVLGDDLGWADLSAYDAPHPHPAPGPAHAAGRAERAVEYVNRDQHQPWLLDLNYTTPPWPWIADGDEEESAEIVRRIKAGDRGALWHQDGGSLDKYRERVEDLDRSVGQVLRALERSGQEEDTLVFFASDNGGERFSYHWPLDGNKELFKEGGIRVPSVLRWPARIGPRQVGDVPVYSPDWTATLLELGGARPHPAYPLDGTSLAGYLLRGERVPERDLFWRVRGERALRRGDWKYHRSQDGTDHLYNLSRDQREQADRATAEPARLKGLRTAWERNDAGLPPCPAAG